MTKNLLLAIRYKNLLILALIFICIELLFYTKDIYSQFNSSFIIAYLSVICTAAGGYVINDLFDISSDILNNKNIKSTFDRHTLRTLYISILLLSIILALINGNVIVIFLVIFASALLFLYSWKLQHLPLAGNLLISTLAGLIPLISFIAHPELTSIILNEKFIFPEGSIYPFILLYSIFAFSTTLSREIIKDIEDIKGDMHVKAKTFPIQVGITAAKIISLIILMFTSSLVVLLILNHKQFGFSIITTSCAVILLLIPLIITCLKLYKARSRKEYNLVSQIIKGIFLCSLIIIIAHSYS